MILNSENLRRKLEDNDELIQISLPFIKNLYNFVKDSECIIVLADSEGYILKIIGDETVKKIMERYKVIVGACWGSKNKWLNAEGNALELGKPTQIFTGRHFNRKAGEWTCSGAPIKDTKGEVIGCLDMTAPSAKANYHTLGMVAAAAYAIENSLSQKKTYEKYQTANNFKDTVIESISEALITIDTDGIITLANEKTKGIFGLPSHMIIGKNIKDILRGKENRNILLNILDNGNSVTDVEVKIFKQDKYSDYTITCNSILSHNKEVVGKIIMLNEINRAKALATRMTGAKASFKFENIIGNNPRFLNTVKLAKLASRSDSTVLLLGESGTGKDVFAQAIHNASERKRGPYVALNCAAIPRDLMSSELFGYSEGAFTGSRKGGNQGKFELADGGTIFLDEISEMPLELQANFLRVLEEKTITRIGGRETIPLNVRIIAASNRNLHEQVRNKAFREDLYYRINVFTMEMIPLRGRKSDIPVLAGHFVKNISKKMNKEMDEIDEKVLDIFLRYTWPGNIRELQNIIERAINIAPTNKLTLDLMPFEIAYNSQGNKIDSEVVPIDEMERQMILKLLKYDFPKNSIAEKLNISRATLYRRLEKYKL